jgi:hypothetical protein
MRLVKKEATVAKRKAQKKSARDLRALGGRLYHAQVNDTGQGFKVRPPTTNVNSITETFFRFKNNTDYPAWVLLPAEITGGDQSPVPVQPHSFAEVEVQGSGPYSYVVVLVTPEGIVSAPGESDPVIIIDP